jgi:hypothetical protein
MRTSITISGVIVGTGIILASSIGPAMADTNNISGTVTAGNLTSTTSDVTLSAVTLDGQATKHSTGAPASPWTITDARGTSGAWALSVSGTDFTSASGVIDTTQRSIAVGKLTITPGTITAGADSDPASAASAVTLSTSPQSLIFHSSAGKGSYSFSPGFDLAVSANAFRSNYSNAIGSSVINPYVSVLTFTIA